MIAQKKDRIGAKHTNITQHISAIFLLTVQMAITTVARFHTCLSVDSST